MARKSTRSRRLIPPQPKVAKNNLPDSLGVAVVNYKDTARLRMVISERGKIRSRRVTGLFTAAPGRHGDHERSRDGPFAVPIERPSVTPMCALLGFQVVHDDR
jgi:ribosomal protein S18